MDDIVDNIMDRGLRLRNFAELHHFTWPHRPDELVVTSVSFYKDSCRRTRPFAEIIAGQDGSHPGLMFMESETSPHIGPDPYVWVSKEYLGVRRRVYPELLARAHTLFGPVVWEEASPQRHVFVYHLKRAVFFSIARRTDFLEVQWARITKSDF